jgi:hypothetical protein
MKIQTNSEISEEPASIHVVPFDGKKCWLYRVWSIKTQAIGMKQGWADALENDYPESSDKKLKEINDKDYTYLVLACEGKPFNSVASKDKRKKGWKGWKALSAKYNVQDCIELTEDYSSSRPDSNWEWLQRLESIANEMEYLDPMYTRKWRKSLLLISTSTCLSCTAPRLTR